MSFPSAPASAAASLIARDITKSFGPYVVLAGVSCTIAPQTRVGIVAPNGTGKTTLLRILAGLDTPDGGSVSRTPPTATVGYLPQIPERMPDESVRAFLGRRTGVDAAAATFDAAAEALAAGTSNADDAYATALEQFLALGAADFDARIGEVLAQVGLEPRILEVPMPALSGGQAARASLASIMLSRFDVFLLDEPTNDLDFAGLALLESFIRQLGGGVAIVSHDRSFLDRTITSVLEIDDHSRTGTLFAGGWQAYLDERAVARRHAEEAYATYQEKRSTLTSRAQQQREWAVQGVRKVKKSGEPDKNIRHFRTQSSERLAGKARATDAALARLDAEAIEKPWEGWELRMELAQAPRSGAVVARFDRACVHRGAFTLGPIGLEIGYGERVAILGANGSGKTTLLRLLLGDLSPNEGKVHRGPSVVIGELDQARGRFASDGTLLDAFLRETGVDMSTARSTLAKFGLGAEHIGREVGTLSPGERTRAVLALFVTTGVNCLVLDEPTNHLDLPAIEQLEQALESYDGTLLLVTHDRALLDAITISREIRLDAGQIVSDNSTI